MVVNINGQEIPSEIIETMFREVQSRKFRYIEKAKTARTEGVRESNRRKVHELDEAMSLLSYATRVPFSKPRRAWE